MSFSPRYRQNGQQQQQKQKIQSFSPFKFNPEKQQNRIYPKILKYQNFSNNLTNKQDRAAVKTQPKFYQKCQKKTHTSIFKQKMESIKPITCYQYEENQFMIQPQKKNQFSRVNDDQKNNNQQNVKQKMHTPCIGLINPMYINVKSNLKRLTNSCQLMKQRQNFSRTNKNLNKVQNKILINKQSPDNLPATVNNSPVKKDKNTESLYFRIVSEMNQYFNSMKLDSFKNNKTQLLVKRNIKSQSQKRPNLNSKQNYEKASKRGYYESEVQQQNLNVISLRPASEYYKKINRNQINSSESPNKGDNCQNQNFKILKIYQSQQFQHVNQLNQNQLLKQPFTQFQMAPIVITNNICTSPVRRGRDTKYSYNNRMMTQDIKNGSQASKRLIMNKGYFFGQISNPKLSADQVYRLKVLYYKDMIWKSTFNLGIRYVPLKNQNSQSANLKFFVGRGNNSKLIRNLMSKRWWWTFDSKQENSQFVWTQLKIYSIYQKQQQFIDKSQKKQKNSKQEDIKLDRQPVNMIQNQIRLKKSKDNSSMLLNTQNKKVWEAYITTKQNSQRQKKITQQNLLNIRKKVQYKLKLFKNIESPQKVTNHLQFSKFIGNKKALYKVMMHYFSAIKQYSQDDIYVPLTYHITAGLQDQQYLKFLTQYYRRNKNANKTCWIVKPGELTNRGRGIIYCRDLNQIKPIVKKKQAHANGSLKTFLIQQYIDRPLLYRGRKFDIRHYIMINSLNGKISGYFYQEGYIRTTSYKYKLDDNSPAIHLTNDAVQKYCKDYGKYEKGNKLSYEQFDAYLQEKYVSEKQQNKITFYNTIHPQIRKISTDVIHAAYYFIDPKKKINNFQIFGLDIMIDQNFKCYLIQVNTNPCLELSSPVLKAVIPNMLDNALTISLDTCYPPPQKQILHQYHKKYKYPISPQNKFELVFDQDEDGDRIRQIYEKQNNDPNQLAGIGDDDQNFQSCDEDSEDF